MITLVQDENGRVVVVPFEGDVAAYTITGTIEHGPGPNFLSRVIEGSLEGGVNEIFWTLDELDTTYDGIFSVQFTATYELIF